MHSFATIDKACFNKFLNFAVFKKCDDFQRSVVACVTELLLLEQILIVSIIISLGNNKNKLTV